MGADSESGYPDLNNRASTEAESSRDYSGLDSANPARPHPRVAHDPGPASGD
jgi:hypothetical protein